MKLLSSGYAVLDEKVQFNKAALREEALKLATKGFTKRLAASIWWAYCHETRKTTKNKPSRIVLEGTQAVGSPN